MTECGFCIICFRKETAENLENLDKTMEDIYFLMSIEIREMNFITKHICAMCLNYIGIFLKFKNRFLSRIRSDIITQMKMYSLGNTPYKRDTGYNGMGPLNPVSTNKSTESDSDDSSSRMSLLQPKFYRDVYTAATESGGMFNHVTADDEMIASQKNNSLRCPECNRKFTTNAGLARHSQKHLRTLKRLVKPEIKSEIPVRFSCNQCNKLFDRKFELNEHSKLHLPQLICKFCNAVFTTMFEFKWHEANCCGVTLAAVQDEVTEARTRSKSVLSDTLSTRSSVGSIQSKRRKRKGNRWTHRKKSKYGPTPTKNGRRGRKRKQPIESDVLVDNNSDDDDNCSVISSFSMASSVLTRVSGLSVCEDGSIHTEDRPNTRQLTKAINKIVTRKTLKHSYAQNRIVVLKRAQLERKQRIIQSFECSYENCLYISEDFDKMNEHCQQEHNSLMLYPCRECRKKYCSETLLSNHVSNHSAGPFLCPLCEDAFEFKDDFCEHMQQHHEVSYPCNRCDFVFIDQNSRKVHKQLRHSSYPYLYKAEWILARADEYRKPITDLQSECSEDISNDIGLTINSAFSIGDVNSRPSTPFVFETIDSPPDILNQQPDVEDVEQTVIDKSLENNVDNNETPVNCETGNQEQLIYKELNNSVSDTGTVDDYSSSETTEDHSITIDDNIFLDNINCGDITIGKEVIIVDPNQDSIDSVDIQNNSFTVHFPDDSTPLLTSDIQRIFEDDQFSI